MTSTNRYLKKSMISQSNPKLLTILSVVGLFCLKTTVTAQNNSIAYEPVNTAAYESPFEHAPNEYKEVIYEEGMPAKLEEKTNLILEDIFFLLEMTKFDQMLSAY